MILALTRQVSPAIVRCELTHLPRKPIDLERARAQHRQYEEALRRLGCTVERLPTAPELADAVFVEDAAVVLDEAAVITRPGAASRRPELESVAQVLGRYRPLRYLQAPATLDGGDVLRVGRTLFVGRSGRSDGAGIAQLGELVADLGYEVRGVELKGCLHLKTAIGVVGPATVLCNPEWVDPGSFGEVEVIEVAPEEPFAANALLVGGGVIHSAAFVRTRERLVARGIAVTPVPADELAKAEGGVTCCSLIVDGLPDGR